MLEELLEIEKVKVDDKEVDKEVTEMAKKYQMKEEDFLKAFGGKDMVQYDLEIRKVIELLKEYNK
jgi:FKBP-type peptidyl-prolyl cis-trans isomerase (trigger factor)